MADLKYTDIANVIALLEGGKSEARVGDIRQVISLIAKLDAVYRYQAYERTGDEAALRKSSRVLKLIANRAMLIATKHAKRKQKKARA